jgi:hypothetical protein
MYQLSLIQHMRDPLTAARQQQADNAFPDQDLSTKRMLTAITCSLDSSPKWRLSHSDLTVASMIKAQTQDTFCKKVRTAMLNPATSASKCYELGADNLIYHFKQKDDVKVSRILVPESMQEAVLLHSHGVPLSGHLSFHRTMGMISTRFYWDGMYKDVKHWVNGCLPCRLRKTPRPMRHGKSKFFTPSEPLELVSMDLVGPLNPSGPEKYTYVLTLMDIFTRFPVAIPLRNKTTAEVQKAFFRHFLTMFGLPRRQR